MTYVEIYGVWAIQMFMSGALVFMGYMACSALVEFLKNRHYKIQNRKRYEVLRRYADFGASISIARSCKN